MGNYICCSRTDEDRSTFDVNKAYDILQVRELKARIIQKRWKRKKEYYLIYEKRQLLHNFLNEHGKFISKQELDEQTLPGIKMIEKSLPMYYNDEFIASDLVFLRPYKYDSDSSIYYGYWSLSAKREGYGVYLDNDRKYEGIWKDDSLIKGRIIESDGSYYEGDISSFLPNGRGTIFYSSGNVFTGEWINGRQNGYGVHRYNNDSIYEGNFHDNLFDGNDCKFYWPNGSVYEGEIIHGVIKGSGTYTTSQGDNYQGIWDNNSPHGEGIYRSGDGNIVYIGQYIHGKKGGKGILRWNSWKYYDGEWLNNLPNGFGVYGDNKDFPNKINGLWRYGKLISVEDQELQDLEINIPEIKENFPTARDLQLFSSGDLKKSKIFKPESKSLIYNFIKHNFEAKGTT